MKRPDVGLIFVGPDPEGVLTDIKGENVFKLGPIYGDKRFDLLSAADVYCLPGAVGLSIIDAFYCGLPFVTEDGDPSAEIAYLKDSVNGFIVPPDNIPVMAEKLLFLLDNEGIRQKFSDAARKEVAENASIDRMCAGFRDALLYVTHQNRAGQY
jgi:glycosyltransferase involved in cell wall biosynthesis